MTLLFAPNLSMLWTDLPLADRFEAAARAGFGAVELWWPGNDAAATLPGLTSRWKLWLALLNFDGGGVAAGERGLAADPRRRAELRANVPVALEIARACGCARLNLLIGKRQAEYSRGDQLDCARGNVAWAGAQAARVGCEVLIEALNPWDNGPCLLTTTGPGCRGRVSPRASGCPTSGCSTTSTICSARRVIWSPRWMSTGR